MQYKKKSYVRLRRKVFRMYCQNYVWIDEDFLELCLRPVKKKWFREKRV